MLAYCHAVVLRIQLSFFSSSRRRHTRWPRDWSSDVCSSDLDDHLGRQELLAGDRFQGPSDGLLFVVKRNDDRNIGVNAINATSPFLLPPPGEQVLAFCTIFLLYSSTPTKKDWRSEERRVGIVSC